MNHIDMTIAVDFDGTIVVDEYPKIGKLQSGAKDTLQRLHKEGHKIIIWTCRSGELLVEAVNYLLNQQIPFDQVNDNLKENIEQYGGNSRKICADVYIDDRNMLEQIDWERIYYYFFNKELYPIYP